MSPTLKPLLGLHVAVFVRPSNPEPQSDMIVGVEMEVLPQLAAKPAGSGMPFPKRVNVPVPSLVLHNPWGHPIMLFYPTWVNEANRIILWKQKQQTSIISTTKGNLRSWCTFIFLPHWSCSPVSEYSLDLCWCHEWIYSHHLFIRTRFRGRKPGQKLYCLSA